MSDKEIKMLYDAYIFVNFIMKDKSGLYVDNCNYRDLVESYVTGVCGLIHLSTFGT
jgi:hypothetical protein